MFGAANPGINWYEVVTKRQAVLLDFRHVHDVEQRRFKMLWVFYSLLAFIKHRGAGRHQPLSLIVDEVAALTHLQSGMGSPFASALDELINVYARNAMIWLCLCHQELFQLEERIQQTLMSLGTQILGVTSDMNAALSVAKQLFRINPYRIKRYEPVYGSISGLPKVIDNRPVEFTIPEQQYEAAYELTSLRLFEFLVRTAAAEGDIDTTLHRVHIKNIDKGQWVHEDLVAKVRELLRQRTGVPIAEVLADIDRRLMPASAILASPPAYANDLPPQETDEDEDDWGEPA